MVWHLARSFRVGGESGGCSILEALQVGFLSDGQCGIERS
jgi:hypothetical protein